MAFEAKDQPVGEVLNKSVFLIPRNQRRYVWTKDNWKELLEDILFSCRENVKPHFIGSVVLKDEGKRDGISNYTIIDGQQRLTTITLILLAIMKLFNEKKMKNEFLGTVDYVMTKNNRNQSMPMLSSPYHISIETLTDATIKLNDENDKPINVFINSNILSKDRDKNIGMALKYYYDEISAEIDKVEDSNERLLQIRDAVINMILVSIVSSSEEDSYTIFEILNARGRELEDYELLKNYIMRYIEPIENRDVAKIKWEEIENKLGAFIKKFISHYAWHKYGIQKEEDTPYRIIQKNTKGGNINTLLDDIKLKSEYYYKLINPMFGENGNCNYFEYKIFSFFKSKRQEQFRPLILSLMHQRELGNLSENYYEQSIKFIYNFFVCYTIIGEEKSNKLRDTVIKYANLLEVEYSDKTLFEFGKALKNKIPSFDWFEKSFGNLGWSNHTEMFKGSKNKQRVQITLEIIEKFTSQRFDIDEFTIEHILPDSQGEKNSHIGNLIPLDENLNGLCKDKTLEDKYKIYEKSNFSSARGIQNRYSEKVFEPSARTKYLAKLVYNNILELNQMEYKEK